MDFSKIKLWMSRRVIPVTAFAGMASATLGEDLNASMEMILSLVAWIAPIATSLIPAVVAFGMLAIVSAFVGMIVTIFYILPKVFKVNILGRHKND